MVKVFELTTNGRDGYRKIYVRGLKNEVEARALAKKGFGKSYWSAKGAIGYYDDEPSKYHEKGYWIKRSMLPKEFLLFTLKIGYRKTRRRLKGKTPTRRKRR